MVWKNLEPFIVCFCFLMEKKYLLFLVAWTFTVGNAAVPYNIVHIVSDDLRPEISSYGVDGRHTPNIDRIAKAGVSFDRAYTQIAVCGPSRNSFLSGRRPDASRSWNFINHFRQDHPGWTSLPGMFLKSQKNSLGVGKMYHPFLPPKDDGDKSWSSSALPYSNPCYFYGISCLPCVGAHKKCSDHGFGPGNVSTCWCEVEAVEDTLTVNRAIELMQIGAKDFHLQNKTFYLAVGLHKPHLPWQAAKKHFDKFPIDSIATAKHKTAPKGLVGNETIAYSSCDSPSPWEPISDKGAKEARRGYYSAVSGMDEQVGRVLNALEAYNLNNNTVVVFHSDHGWQLGEHGEWRKNTNFELATRVPLIIRPPNLSPAIMGSRTAALVELVDLMPTIADFAGIDLANIVKKETPLAGKSLIDLVLCKQQSIKTAAFSQYPRAPHNVSIPYRKNGIDHKNRSMFYVMGYSIRTTDWRYTEWRLWNRSSLTALWDTGGLYASELYDHRQETGFPTNFDVGENDNVFEQYSGQKIVGELAVAIRRQFCKISRC